MVDYGLPGDELAKQSGASEGFRPLGRTVSKRFPYGNFRLTQSCAACSRRGRTPAATGDSRSVKDQCLPEAPQHRRMLADRGASSTSISVRKFHSRAD